jgi:hypothetical protein
MKIRIIKYREVIRMEINFLWVGIGLAALGYFIGDGLKNFKNPKGNFSDYPILIKEKDLYLYLGLSKEEVNELLRKYPDAPKIELKGTTYYPYQHFLEWLSSNEIYKN